jgi:hypothetical protein
MTDLLEQVYTLETYPDRRALLDKHRDWYIEFDFWYEGIIEQWKEKLEELGFRDVDIAWSGFWCQGDGASFTAKSIRVRDYMKARKLSRRFPSVARILQWDWDVWGFVYRTGYYHYVHEHSVIVNLENNYCSEDRERENRVYNQIGELEAYIQEDVRELSKQIYRELEQEYDHYTSDEEIEAVLADREFDYTGELI